MESKFKIGIDLVAAANVVATIVGWLPSIAALMSILWLGLQFYTWCKTRPDLKS